MNSLYKHIPKDVLPAEYGGTQPPFDNTTWRQRILNNEDYFVKLESYCNGTNNNNMNINNNNDLHHSNGVTNCGDEDDNEEYCDAEDDDNKSLDVEVDGNSIHYIDTETEDSEYDEDDKRILSPRRKAPPMESLEEMFLKHDFSTFTLKEKDIEELK